MYVARVSTRVQFSKQTASHLSKVVAANFSQSCSGSLHRVGLGASPVLHTSQSHREFSTTPRAALRDFFPQKETELIRKTKPAWEHPDFSYEDMKTKVFYAHREPADFSDRVALWMVRLLRWGTDLATGYKHDVEVPKKIGDANAVAETKPYGMSERKWLIRIIFLESVAGVPGMVAAMLRHLHSMRRLKRDNGWIETLLEESQNERMHLLTFLKMAEPGWFMKFMLLGAQGVFFNSMFISYLISPRTCHRFVGYLEEEAVFTYTLAIQDLEAGKLPQWTHPDFRVPDIAVDYWKMPEDKRTMRDLMLYVRADEAKHREVNHTLGNLDQDEDPNPFVSEYKDVGRPHPGKGIEHVQPIGWERKDVI
ncbi:hypothetical protein HYFRA_00006842 [Hymenoscyphus fraxineus]|uniref:Alternative oxidase n=1 Tax=Hymenoscyphus fraxineus TaxID=746836 RepID=A0A9N9KN30_9HELO|nr:hypothetical protein HYFRA_00006842 [Hymenoscyphus fraxineus]